LFSVYFRNLLLRRETAPIRTLLVNPNVDKSFLALLFNFWTGLRGLLGLSAVAVNALILILNFLCRRKVHLQSLGSKFIIRGVILLLLRFLKLPR
jgi:hypothetical protein